MKPLSTDGTLATDRAADILVALLSASGPAGVTEVARRLGLPKSVVHRAIQSLTAREILVRVPPGKYLVSPYFRELSAGHRAEAILVEASEDAVHGVRDLLGHTTAVSSLRGLRRVALMQVPSRNDVDISLSLGRPRPLLGTATGEVMLAHLDETSARRVIGGVPTHLHQSIDSRLSRIRSRGFAISDPARVLGFCAVAAPVSLYSVGVVAAFTSLVPVAPDSPTVQHIGDQLVKAAAIVTQRLDSAAGSSGSACCVPPDVDAAPVPAKNNASVTMP